MNSLKISWVKIKSSAWNLPILSPCSFCSIFSFLETPQMIDSSNKQKPNSISKRTPFLKKPSNIPWRFSRDKIKSRVGLMSPWRKSFQIKKKQDNLQKSTRENNRQVNRIFINLEGSLKRFWYFCLGKAQQIISIHHNNKFKMVNQRKWRTEKAVNWFYFRTKKHWWMLLLTWKLLKWGNKQRKQAIAVSNQKFQLKEVQKSLHAPQTINNLIRCSNQVSDTLHKRILLAKIAIKESWNQNLRPLLCHQRYSISWVSEFFLR